MLQNAKWKLANLQKAPFSPKLTVNRGILVRATLEQASYDHRELEDGATSTSYDERQKAMEETRKLVGAASENDQGAATEQRACASFHFWRSVAHPGALNFDEDQLVNAATASAAKLTFLDFRWQLIRKSPDGGKEGVPV